ncbi:putative meiosis specific protein hop1 protein [Botrytis fragariae]|uniref:Putative meiosis specific protein hop1 protein n=1 Tax=Botrytis fragariae TaxID=1964551 RepID=A0A8H6EM31_9HELO|nr:putative meiosis specific protein hop1 protein [Botrytis fragariae]KAF5877139.1 putative meiosis specific protein hop1 protein [Botrytis fragariae]
MAPKLHPKSDRPVRVKSPVKPQTKAKQKGNGKAKAPVDTPKTVPELVLNQQQSFELVKIGVNAAVSQFVFGRKFFPTNCYKTRIYDASDPNPTYEAFINGANIPRNFHLNKAGDEIVSFSSVVRGTGHPGAEKLLDWLEFGVGHAVSDKCLAKFQLSLYRKEVVPEQLVEAFTINFTYKDVEENSHVQISASLSNKNGNTVSLGSAQEGLRDLIRQVMNSSRNLQGQSIGRKVSMQLVYNDNTRPKHEYRGFHALSTSQILPDGCGILMGQTSTGVHGLEIKYYDAPAMDTHVPKATALDDAKVTSDRKRLTTARGLKSTTPLANVMIGDNSQSSLRHSQLSQSVDTQQSTMRWINQIGHAKGSDDMDTQPIPACRPTTSGKHTPFLEREEVNGKGIEEVSEEEEEVQCECHNYEDRENLESRTEEFFIRRYTPYVAADAWYIILNRMASMIWKAFANWNLEKTQKELESLKTEGIIKKCPKSSKEPFRFSDIKKLQMELFDPSKHIPHTKPFATAVTKPDLTHKSLDQTQLTPVGRRLRQPDGSIRSGLRSEGSSTQTPSSLRRSPRSPAQTTPQQPNKRTGDEGLDSARKRMRSALSATSPFSLRSNGLY